jgi:hypothetical protein
VAVVSCFVLSAYVQCATAQETDFGRLTASAKGDIRPLSDQQVQQRLSALKDAANRLSAYLTGSNGAAWKQYLKWDLLEEQLTAGEKADPAALEQVRRQLVANHVGLEMPVFANLATALDRAISAIEAAQADDFRGAVEKQIDQLATNVGQYEQSPGEEQAAAIGQTVGWLERTGQAGPLVQAVRRRFRQPNLYIRVSEGLVGAGIGRPIDDVGPIHDNILGTDVHGTAHTVGALTVQLVPNLQRASLETVLTGNVYSQTVGYNGPATICSLGSTCINGRKLLTADWNGLTGYAPTARASTRADQGFLAG